jgi:hypothetical protein
VENRKPILLATVLHSTVTRQVMCTASHCVLSAEPDFGASAEPDFGASAEPDFGASAEPDFGASAEPDFGASFSA